MKHCLFLFALLLAVTLSATEVDRLLTEYQQIKTVTCQIRRTSSGGNQTVRFLSRVYWQNDDRLHVENLSPIPRRIVSNGNTFFSYAQGDPKGFSRPVDALSEEMTISLRKIPGTPMDHLLRLKGLEEKKLNPDGTLTRTGYQAEKRYVVLRVDSLNRLEGIDFFETSTLQEKVASYRYSNFKEVLSGVWVPLLQEAVLAVGDDQEVSETVQVDRFVANEPVAKTLFDPATFFDKQIDFVDSFAKIYGE